MQYREIHDLFVLAADHRHQFEGPCREAGADIERLGDFKKLLVESAIQVSRKERGTGVILDYEYGASALKSAHLNGLWTAAPIEVAGSRPLLFEGGAAIGHNLSKRPQNEIVKCLCHYHPEDPSDLRVTQETSMISLFDACKTHRRFLLLEIIPPQIAGQPAPQMATIIDHLYSLGIKPHWWKLEPQPTDQAWRAIAEVIAKNAPDCRGIFVLGNEQSSVALMDSFKLACMHEIVIGFAIGRSIHLEILRSWLRGALTDGEVVNQAVARFLAFIDAWKAARPVSRQSQRRSS